MPKGEKDMVFAAGVVDDDHRGDGEAAQGVQGNKAVRLIGHK
jgi:hypothetical protein